MVTVLLYGFLGKQFGKVHRYDVKSPAEAVRALSATLKGFRQALVDGGSYRVVVGGKDSLTIERTTDPISSRETIRIVPVISGAGNGFGQVVLGAVLVAVAYFLPGPWSPYLYKAGAVLILGGVSQMLFAPPPMETGAGGVDRPENKPSYAFDGAVNTAAQGNPVSVCYGYLIVGSQVVSAGLSAEQIA